MVEDLGSWNGMVSLYFPPLKIPVHPIPLIPVHSCSLRSLFEWRRLPAPGHPFDDVGQGNREESDDLDLCESASADR